MGGRFKIAIAAVLENSNEEILLIKRSDYGGYPFIWDIPGGGKEALEDPYIGLRREIKEETGITEITIQKLIHLITYFKGESYNKDADVIIFIFWCKTNETKVTLSFEHTEHIWIKPDEALKIVKHKDVIVSIQSFIEEKQRFGKK